MSRPVPAWQNSPMPFLREATNSLELRSLTVTAPIASDQTRKFVTFARDGTCFSLSSLQLEMAFCLGKMDKLAIPWL